MPFTEIIHHPRSLIHDSQDPFDSLVVFDIKVPSILATFSLIHLPSPILTFVIIDVLYWLVIVDGMDDV